MEIKGDHAGGDSAAGSRVRGQRQHLQHAAVREERRWLVEGAIGGHGGGNALRKEAQ